MLKDESHLKVPRETELLHFSKSLFSILVVMDEVKVIQEMKYSYSALVLMLESL